MAHETIQLHRLEGFFWVARTGGYARAARAFPYPITQPAVHNQVKKLEEELGLSLFERVAKDRMAPTAAGQRLYDFIRPFFEALPTVLRSVRSGEHGGELRVTSTSLLLRYLVPEWIQRLHATHPDVLVHLEETAEDAVDLLRAGSVDLAIDHLYEIPKDIATMRVGSVEPHVVLPADPSDADAPVDLKALKGMPFVAYATGQKARELQFTALAEAGIAPPTMLSATSAEVILGFVEAGLGWSILPVILGGTQDRLGTHVRSTPLVVGDVTPSFDLYAAWRKDTPENPLLDAMLEAAPR
ncbi:MAG: LysR family transcriptional regulator [Planctomycetota bacterium]